MVGIDVGALEQSDRRALSQWLQRRRLPVATVGLWAVAALTSAIVLHPSDVSEYEHYARAALHTPLLHHLPREYPAPSLALFVAPLALPVRYPAAFALEMGLVLVALVVGYGKYAEGAVADEPAMRLLAYLAVGAVMVLTGRYDLAAAAATFWSVRAAGRGRYQRAWAWSAVGVALKLFPAALWPVLLVAEARGGKRLPWRRLWWAGGAVVAVAVIPLVADRGALLDVLRYYVDRPLEAGSMAAGLSVLVDWGPSRWSTAAQSLTVTNGASAVMGTAVAVVALAACLWVWWNQYRGRLSLQAAALATLTFVVLGSKVFSVQYVMWLIPFWALYRMRTSWTLGAAMGTVAFPVASSIVAFQYLGYRGLGATLTLLYLARDLLIAGGTVAWLRELRTPG